MPVIPRDFLDDDDDSYITNLAPSLEDDELQDFPVNLAALDITKLPLQVINPKQWGGIIKLIDPLHLLGIYQLLSLAIAKTWEYEHKCAVEDAIKKSQNTPPTTTTSTMSDDTGPVPPQPQEPIDPQNITPSNPNPPLTMETYPDSIEGKYMTFPMIEILTSQILPLFGMMVMKAHWKGENERYEYRFRFGAKPLRVMDALALMGDINQILALQDAIQIEDIAGRLFLSLLTTMLKRNAFVKQVKTANDDDDDDDDVDMTKIPPTDYSQLWFEMSQFDIVVNYSTKPLSPNDTISLSTSSPDPKSVQQVDFLSGESMYNYFKGRSSRLSVDILNNIVINYDRNLILLTIPCQSYALPIRPNVPPTTSTTNTTNVKQTAAQKAAAAAKQAAMAKKGIKSVTPQTKSTTQTTTTTTSPIPAAIPATTGVQPSGFAILPLNADVFALLPNILISVVKAIITFKIKQAQSDHKILQLEAEEQQRQKASNEKVTEDSDNMTDGEGKDNDGDMAGDNDDDNKSTTSNISKKPTKKLMSLSTIHKFASLFKFLMANRMEYTPNVLINTWLLLTEENSSEGQQELLTKEFNKMVITPKCLENLPTQSPQNEQEMIPASNNGVIEIKTAKINDDGDDDNNNNNNNDVEKEHNEDVQSGEQDDEEDLDFDSLALSVSISLASNYINHGFAHANRVFDVLFNQYQKEQMSKR